MIGGCHIVIGQCRRVHLPISSQFCSLCFLEVILWRSVSAPILWPSLRTNECTCRARGNIAQSPQDDSFIISANCDQPAFEKLKSLISLQVFMWLRYIDACSDIPLLRLRIDGAGQKLHVLHE